MSAAPTQVNADAADVAEEPGGRPPRRHRLKVLIAIAVVVVLAAAGAVVAVTRPFGGGSHPASGVRDNGYPTSLATVTLQTLSAQTNVNGTLGYAGNYSVVNQASGAFTYLPSPGQVIRQGHVLYRLDNKPVVLLFGSVPAYRSLSEGTSGPDVKQLNADLVALGYATSSELDPHSDYFGSETQVALEKLQAHLGVDQNGKLTLGQAVFLPSVLRITAVSGALGTRANPGMSAMSATSTARQVSINLDAAQQSEVKVGDAVTITLPDNRTTPGTVSSVGKVASSGASGSGPTIAVDVTLTNPAASGNLDQAPVQVAITTASVRNALVVPVNALLALSGGGFAVEQVTPSGVHRVVAVSLGLFDDADGLVQVSGSGLAAGQHVVVPAT